MTTALALPTNSVGGVQVVQALLADWLAVLLVIRGEGLAVDHGGGLGGQGGHGGQRRGLHGLDGGAGVDATYWEGIKGS